MNWTCPSCGTGWPEKPLVDGTIGCPECGSIAATGVDPVRALAGWAAEDAEGRVMTLVEDPSFADWVPMVLARLSAAEQERDQANACIDALEEALFDVATFNRETGALIGRSRDDLETRVEALRAAEARAEAAEQALGKVERATDPAHGSAARLTHQGMARRLDAIGRIARAALAGREERQ